jgi:hypothetical protein
LQPARVSAGRRRDHPHRPVLVEHLAVGRFGKHAVDADPEVTGKADALDAQPRPAAHRHPEHGTADRDPRAALEDEVQVMGARVTSPGEAQPDPLTQQRADDDDGLSPAGAPEAITEVTGQRVDGPKGPGDVDLGAILGSQPQRALGDVAARVSSACQQRAARIHFHEAESCSVRRRRFSDATGSHGGRC